MKNAKKLLFACITLFVVSSPMRAAQTPLANENLSGIYSRSIENVLRLDEDEIDLATAVLIISEQWNRNVSGRRYLERLDDMAYEIRERLDPKNTRAKYRAIEVINKYLFDEIGFTSIAEANNPDDLFLHSVLDRKKGYCLSLSILYLAIGERLGLDLYGVVVPGHFFVRYDDGKVRFNIETTSNGGSADDEHYIKKFKVPPAGEGNIYLLNLNKRQTLGCFFNNLGNSYFDVGNFDSALLALERAVQINPSLAESRTNLGNVYLKLDRADDAVQQYLRAIDINPDDAKTYNNLGNAYAKQGQHRYAISAYEKAMELDPNFIDVYINLSAAYANIKMHGKAISLLRGAINIKPRYAPFHSQLGNIYADAEEYEQAISYYKNALRLGPPTSDIHYGLAVCYNRLNRPDDEIAEYEKTLSLNPDMVPALINLGNAYFAKKEYNQSIRLYEKAVRIEPENHNTHYNLAAACFNTKNYARAAQEYAKVIEIDPGVADAHSGLGYALYNLKEYKKALTHLKIARELGAKVDDDIIKAVESEL